MEIKTVLIDNLPEIMWMSDEAKEQALVAIGSLAEGYAKRLCPVDTGRLRNSITFAYDKNSVYVGTNVEYATYQELGTKKIKGKHFIGKSIEDHIYTYEDVISMYYNKSIGS